MAEKYGSIRSPVVSVICDSLPPSRKAAQAYLEYLYTEPAQEIIARNFYRPVDPKVEARFSKQFPTLTLFTVDAVFGGWQKAHRTHFADGGVFDQIYQPSR